MQSVPLLLQASFIQTSLAPAASDAGHLGQGALPSAVRAFAPARKFYTRL